MSRRPGQPERFQAPRVTGFSLSSVGETDYWMLHDPCKQQLGPFLFNDEPGRVDGELNAHVQSCRVDLPINFPGSISHY